MSVHCNPNASTYACFQQNVHQTQQQELGAISWILNTLNQLVLDLFWGLVHTLLLLGFWAAVLAMVGTVLYANFGQRIPRPHRFRLVVHAANPELYE